METCGEVLKMNNEYIDYREEVLSKWFTDNDYDLRFELFEDKNFVILEAFKNSILEAKLEQDLSEREYTIADLMHKLFNILNGGFK